MCNTWFLVVLVTLIGKWLFPTWHSIRWRKSGKNVPSLPVHTSPCWSISSVCLSQLLVKGIILYWHVAACIASVDYLLFLLLNPKLKWVVGLFCNKSLLFLPFIDFLELRHASKEIIDELTPKIFQFNRKTSG